MAAAPSCIPRSGDKTFMPVVYGVGLPGFCHILRLIFPIEEVNRGLPVLA